MGPIPSSAWNARSTFPPLATRTALITAASTLGKASFNVFSASCRGLSGRGGFGGGTSSLEPNCDCGFDAVVVGGVAVTTPASWGSSSKSSGRAVVGDSGCVVPATAFTGDFYRQYQLDRRVDFFSEGKLRGRICVREGYSRKTYRLF